MNIRLLQICLIFGTAVVIGFLYLEEEKRNNELERQIINLREKQLLTALDHERALIALGANLEETKTGQAALITDLQYDLKSGQQKASVIEAELGKVSGSVSTLEKLTNTDEELLQKYSKVYFLNEHYIPARLFLVPSAYTFDTKIPKQDFQIHASIWSQLKEMMDAVDSAVHEDILIVSAYRSFGTQARLKSHYVVTYGAGSANQFSADQGYSEHQLGTTVDFTIGSNGPQIEAFENSRTFQWLSKNAYKYGFTLSYDKDNKFYTYEPWHWRFVGIKLATHLYETGKYFYDLDQREIDKYLVSIFE